MKRKSRFAYTVVGICDMRQRQQQTHCMYAFFLFYCTILVVFMKIIQNDKHSNDS